MEPQLQHVTTPADLADRLREVGYVPDLGISTVGYLALTLQRPLLVEGEPGTGKTALAVAFADALEIPLIRLQCYEGIDAQQALYDWDFARQILHLRTLEAAGGEVSDRATEGVLYSERFLLARPILQALREAPAVLLIDEVDRADDEFEAFLLEVLSAYQVTVPELGTIRAETPPIVILTSNRTRDVHDALKRRCLYHWIDHPDLDREIEIVRTRLPEVTEQVTRRVVEVVQVLRAEHRLVKLPGVAETIDWARAVHALGKDDLDLDSALLTIGALSKYREDHLHLQAVLPQALGR